MSHFKNQQSILFVPLSENDRFHYTDKKIIALVVYITDQNYLFLTIE